MKVHLAYGISAFTECGLETFKIYSEYLTTSKEKITCKKCIKKLNK